MRNAYSGVPYLVSRHEDLGREVWARYDRESELFVLSTGKSGTNLVGEAETTNECIEVAREWFRELCEE